jgi:hypothetical protein
LLGKRRLQILEGKNRYHISEDGSCVVGFTKKGEEFYFDIEDFEKVKKHSWNLSKRGYITTNIHRRARPMHKVLLGDIKGADIDHISGNKLDNRRSNLRVCTHQENMFNQRRRCTNTTGFMGVSFMKRVGRYEAYVHCGGKKHYAGLFDNAADAAKARDKKASILFGEFARLNFPARRESSG